MHDSYTSSFRKQTQTGEKLKPPPKQIYETTGKTKNYTACNGEEIPITVT